MKCQVHITLTREIVKHPIILYVLNEEAHHALIQQAQCSPQLLQLFPGFHPWKDIFPSTTVNLSKNYSRMTTHIHSDVAERNKMA
jgi:hypothetical protein